LIDDDEDDDGGIMVAPAVKGKEREARGGVRERERCMVRGVR